MESEIGKIDRVELGFEDHNILSFVIQFDFGSSSQAIAGYSLTDYDNETRTHSGSAFGMDFIYRILRSTGARNWERLINKVMIVWREVPFGAIIGIENLPFEPGEKFMFNELKEKHYGVSK